MGETKKTLVERLFAQHRGHLQTFFFRRVHSHPDAAELAQEVYVRMLRVPDMEAIRNPEAYLYTVASNLGKEHARQEHKDAGQFGYLEIALVALSGRRPGGRHRTALNQ